MICRFHIVLSVTGTATVNGSAGVGPSTSGPITATYPAHYNYGGGASSIVIGAFTDASGNVVAPGSGLDIVFSIGAAATVTVRQMLCSFMLVSTRILSANTFHFPANSGSFPQLAGNDQSYCLDITTVGQVAAYVWQYFSNAGGGFTGKIRTMGDQVRRFLRITLRPLQQIIHGGSTLHVTIRPHLHSGILYSRMDRRLVRFR